MKYTVENANEYIINNKDKIIDFYRAKFHMEPPIGWMNDPNGLIKFNNKFHLFYQFHPYLSVWGPMHWGHFISDDLIKYENVEVALAPENQDVESGCFSGCALVDNDKLHLIYTSHYEKEEIKKENQAIATSTDGIKFTKSDKLIVDINELPDGVEKCDFRDPAVFKIEENYYMFVGGKLKTDQGVLLVFKSETLSDFKYDFMIGPYKEFGSMLECPDYLKIDNKDVFLFSSCSLGKDKNNFHNVNSSLYMVGELDLKNKKFYIDAMKEIDKGDAFYAPKFIANHHEPIMIGWLEMWGKLVKTHELNHGYAGAFTLPRKIKIIDNYLCQKPIDSLYKYTAEVKQIKSGDLISRTGILRVKKNKDFTLILKSLDKKYDVKIFANEGYIYLDTTNANNLNPLVRKSDLRYENTDIEIVLDSSSIEVFIGEGQDTISSRIFLEDSKYIVEFTSLNNVEFRGVNL